MAGRYRILLVEDAGGALVRRPRQRRGTRQDPPEEFPREALGLGVLLEAVERLRRQGPGPEGWRTSLSDDPIAFLLDSMTDAFLVRCDQGEVLYANPVAEQIELMKRTTETHQRFQVKGVNYVRRSMRYHLPNRVLILEIASKIL